MSKKKTPKKKKLSKAPPQKTIRKKKEPNWLENLLLNRAKLVVLTLLTLLGAWLFMDYLLFQQVYVFKDMGSDTLNLFYPQFVQVADYLREYGFPTTWSFRHGMGQNILPFNTGDPFNWLMYLTGGQELAYTIAYAELLKIILAGFFFFLFLRTLQLRVYVALIGSIFYAFSGFMIVGGGWYIFSSEAVFAALLFYAFELFYSKGRWQLLPIATFLVGSYLPYNFIPYAILILVYSLFRFIGDRGWQPAAYARMMGGAILWCLLGVGMSLLFTVSGFVQMWNSPRVAGETSLFASLLGQTGLESGLHYGTAIKRFFSNDLLGTASDYTGWRNYLEAPMFYCGLLSLLLAPQVFSFLDRKKKILFGVLAFLFLAPIAIPYLRYAFWLFTGDYYRGFSLVVAGGLLFFGMHALHYILQQGKVHLLTLGITLAVLLLLLFLPVPDAVIDANIRGTVVLFLLLEAACIYVLTLPAYKTIAQVVLLLLVCVEVAVLASPSVNDRSVLSATELESKTGYNDYTVDALDYIRSQDPGFYRVVKDYSSGTAVFASINDARIQGFFGTPSYHSFNNNSYIRFLREMELINLENEEATRFAIGLKPRPYLVHWASTKYLLAKDDKYFLPGSTPIHQVGDVQIFQANSHLPMGFTYDRYIPRSAFQQLDFLKKDISLYRAVVLEDEQIGAFPDLSVIDPSTYPADYSPSLMAGDVNQLREGALNITDFKEYRIVGNLSLDRPKMLFFSIPYDAGWSATVNGTTMPIQQVNIGFMGLMLPAGQHEIVMHYQPPFYIGSIVISLLSLLLYVGLLVYRGRAKKST